MIYDGDCGFCKRWIERWQRLTRGKVNYVTIKDARELCPEIPEADLKRAVHLVEPGGLVYRGAEAVFQVFSHAPAGFLLAWPARVPGLLRLLEGGYAFIARRRMRLSRVMRVLTGGASRPYTYFISRSIFLRLLGGVYLVAFLSFWSQADGLIGSNGILPAEQITDQLSARAEPLPFKAFPSLYRLAPSDLTIDVICATGVLAAVLLMAGLLPIVMLIVLWLFYLSLTLIGQVFMGYQWEMLLLETGFLAIWYAPLQWRLSLSRLSPPILTVRLLLWWLMFRLMIASGAVKLISNDPAWWDLTALTYHYWSQPIPTWTAWFAHQLPLSIQMASCLIMFVIEIGCPFLFFLPRTFRLIGAVTQIVLQVLILATGNYTYFNLLAITICITLIDDAAWPRRLRQRVPPRRGTLLRPRWLWLYIPHRSLVYAVAVVILILTIPLTYHRVYRGMQRTLETRRSAAEKRAPRPLDPPHPAMQKLWEWHGDFTKSYGAFHLANGYGLFASMTKTRPEIIFEGTRDGHVWQPYVFKWKPGDVARPPGFVAPHQPRVDWQLWFAALGAGYQRQNPWALPRNDQWIFAFIRHLLEGTPQVLELLGENPFPDEPPRAIRAEIYRYRFTDPEARAETGAWWTREYVGPYLPQPVGLEHFPNRR